MDYTASADIGLCLYPNTSLNQYYCLPNKIFEYAMAGLPLLVNDLLEIRKLVEDYDCGIIMEGESGQALVSAINKIMEADLAKLSRNARKLVKKYNWETQEKTLLGIYQALLNK